jgi:PAS domain-containing protein
MEKEKTSPPANSPESGGDAQNTEYGQAYSVFFDFSAIATVIIEEDGTISRINRRFEEMSGYPRDEVEGKKTMGGIRCPGRC